MKKVAKTMISKKIVELQKFKVDELISLSKKVNLKEYVLKAPTGSGKTYMEAYLMARLLQEHPNCKIIYQSLSKGNLTQQSYNSLLRYKKENHFNEIEQYLLTSDIAIDQDNKIIPNDYNVYFLPRDLNKKNSRLMTPLKRFLEYQTKDCPEKFLIIDECHEAHSNLNQYIANKVFQKVYGFSATPKLKQLQYFIELDENDCENHQLIKKKQFVHKDDDIFFDHNNKAEIESYVENKVKQAWNDFKKIKKEYKGSGVNPALIIQINNNAKREIGLIQKNKIIEVLSNLDEKILWYYRDAKKFESNDKINDLKGSDRNKKAWNYVKNNNSGIDVIIFKLALSVGVDIPRACYLLQIRDTDSWTLDQQVIGRIRRNPKLKDWNTLSENLQKTLMVAYINGVERQEPNKVKIVKRITNIQIKTTMLINKIPKLLDPQQTKLKKYHGNCDLNVFKLKKAWDLLDDTIKKSYGEINQEKWIDLCMNIDLLKQKSFEFQNDYHDNLKVNNSELGLPLETYYQIERKEQRVKIKKWNWRQDNLDQIYSFESVAEAQIASDLSKLLGSKNIKLWGKNWFNGSKICFEYFLKQRGRYLISRQYPDFFIIKDNKKYLIEVKSYVGKQTSNEIDYNDYLNKVESIRRVYQEIAKQTDQIMVLIIQEKQDDWKTLVYKKNQELILLNDCKYDFLK